jgi:CRP-like cAMP-binding protein
VRLRRDTKIELIKSVPLFSHCSKKELGEIAALADELSLPESRVLVREGDRGREFFVLIEGRADVHRKNRKVATLKDGDFFGEIALVSNVPRTATVTTTTPVRVLVLTDRAFKGLLEHAPEVQFKVLRALAERVAPQTL